MSPDAPFAQKLLHMMLLSCAFLCHVLLRLLHFSIPCAQSPAHKLQTLSSYLVTYKAAPALRRRSAEQPLARSDAKVLQRHYRDAPSCSQLRGTSASRLFYLHRRLRHQKGFVFPFYKATSFHVPPGFIFPKDVFLKCLLRLFRMEELDCLFYKPLQVTYIVKAAAPVQKY